MGVQHTGRFENRASKARGPWIPPLTSERLSPLIGSLADSVGRVCGVRVVPGAALRRLTKRHVVCYLGSAGRIVGSIHREFRVGERLGVIWRRETYSELLLHDGAIALEVDERAVQLVRLVRGAWSCTEMVG